MYLDKYVNIFLLLLLKRATNIKIVCISMEFLPSFLGFGIWPAPPGSGAGPPIASRIHILGLCGLRPADISGHIYIYIYIYSADSIGWLKDSFTPFSCLLAPRRPVAHIRRKIEDLTKSEPTAALSEKVVLSRSQPKSEPVGCPRHNSMLSRSRRAALGMRPWGIPTGIPHGPPWGFPCF